MQRLPSLFVAPSFYGGRGVFTTAVIQSGTLIEVCPVIVIPKDQVQIVHSTILHDYYFLWGDEEKEAALALGFGSLYNHETMANATYEMDFNNLNIEIYALRDIAPGEEITINYHGEQGVVDELWFPIKN